MDDQKPVEDRIATSFEIISVLARLGSDKKFNEDIVAALESGDREKVDGLLQPMGVRTLTTMPLEKGQISIGGNVGPWGCITIIVTVCG